MSEKFEGATPRPWGKHIYASRNYGVGWAGAPCLRDSEDALIALFKTEDDCALTQQAVNSFDAVERLVEAADKFVCRYSGNQQALLGNGQAYRSCDEIREALTTLREARKAGQ